MCQGFGPGLGTAPKGPPDGREVDRDLFPLPEVVTTPAPLGLFSRGSKQRIGRRQHFEAEVKRTVSSLNAMYGKPGKLNAQAQMGAKMSQGQAKVLEFVEHAVRRVGAPAGLTGSEALEELRVSEGYEALPTSSPLGSFDPELIALPAIGGQPVPLASLWGEDGQREVEDFIRTQTLGAAEAEEKKRSIGLTKTYEDPQFKDHNKYAGFVKRLYDLSLVDVSLAKPQEAVSIFFVKKKAGKLRMILDCRLANTHFAEPEGIRLASADSITKMEVPGQAPLYTASADLQNAFYTMGMPMGLRQLFGLKKVRASELGISEVAGVPVRPEQWVYPRVAVIPMGWSHAMWWCQRLSEKLVEGSGLLKEERVRDFDPVPAGNFWHIEYVDNLVVFGTDKAEVERRFWLAVTALREAGLTVHEIEFGTGECKVLGWAISEQGVVSPTSSRLWRLRLGIREILKRGRASGQQLERLVGHMTFVSLCRREAISALGDIYTFIRRHYSTVVPLWKSVRRELSCWDGVSPLIFVNLGTPWNDTLYSVDASEWGMGVTTSKMDQQAIATLGRHVERWRFRDPLAKNPRLYVHEADYVVGAVESPIDEEAGGVAATSQPELPKSRFATVGFEVVDRVWKVVGRHRWRRLDSMPVYEARATQYAIRHALRNTCNFCQRFIVLTDSMTAAVSFDKGRSHGFKLRRVIQQTAALTLSTGVQFRSRWVPSEWNPADLPSRGGWTASIPKYRFGDDSPALGHSSDLGQTIQGQEKTPSRRIQTCAEIEAGRGSTDMGYRAKQRSRADEAKAASCKEEASQAGQSRQNFAKVLRQQQNPEDLRQDLERVSAMESRARPFTDVVSGLGFAPHCISGTHLRAGRRLEQGQLCHGSCDFQQAGQQRIGGHAYGAAVHERVAQAMPSSKPDANTFRSHVPASAASRGMRQEGGRPGDHLNLLALPPAVGAVPARCSRHRQADQKGCRSVQEVCHPTAPDGDGYSLENTAVGRDALFGFGSPSFPGAGSCRGPSAKDTQQAGGGLQSDNGGSDQFPGECLEERRFHSHGGASSLSPAPRRSLVRKREPSQRPHCHSSPGSMADLEVCEELREGGQTTATFRKFGRSRSATMPRGGRKAAKTLPVPALSNRATLHFAVFLEIFSGCGRLGQQVCRECGWPVLLWDISYGHAYDLTVRANQQRIVHWIQHGLVRAGHLGTPCSSFSRARDRPGGPPPLRTDSMPMGRTALRPGDAARVTVGNVLLRFSCRVLLLAVQYRMPFTLENPKTSRIWLTPPLLRILRNRCCVVCDVDFCMFGTRWRKPTRVLSVHLALDGLQQYRCCGTKRGPCSRTGKPHVPLIGQDATGRWLTQLAQSYPLRFARALAKCFLNTELSSIAAEFGRHLDL